MFKKLISSLKMILRNPIKHYLMNILRRLFARKSKTTISNTEKRLYVLIDKELDSIYGCVQGGHVVAEWLLKHPQQDWNNSYLIYVSADILVWKEKLDILEVDYTEFREPDLDNKVTALAILNNDRLFKKLRLIK
jgi:hypothetical protein